MPTSASYSRAQVVLHWTIAALVAFQILFSGEIESLWGDRMRGTIPDVAVPTAHSAVGLLILVLMGGRVWLRLTRGAPPLPASEPRLLSLLAHANHAAFYVLLLAMPVAGAVAWFGGVRAAASAHTLAASLLIALIFLHLAGALAQHFWFRSDVLRRMFRA